MRETQSHLALQGSGPDSTKGMGEGRKKRKI